jgi:hypothetical protein
MRTRRTRSQRTAFWGYAATVAFAAWAAALAVWAPAAPTSAPAPAPGFERAYAVAYAPAGLHPRWVYVACEERVLRYPVSFDGEILLGGYASRLEERAKRGPDAAR